MTSHFDLIAARGIGKSFPGVRALDTVDFTLRRGEIHALLGENGAGKSTLIKIISGVYPPSAGTVEIRGAAMQTFTPHAARGLGVGTVYQGLSLVPTLTVLHNLFLGQESVTNPRLGWLNLPDMRHRAHDVLAQVGLDVDPETEVSALSVSQQQLVEIGKVLLLGAEALIMDEPTDKLTAREARRLFELLRAMRSAGKGVIYITHKLDDVAEIADRVTVLRDGRHVATVAALEASTAQLIQFMVGRELRDLFPKRPVALGAERLRVEGLNVPGVLWDIRLHARAGEIVGLVGLVGSGRTELAKALVGAVPHVTGDLFVDGQRRRIASPEQAVRCGLALLPEDRHREGVFLHMPVRENIVMPSLRRAFLRFREMSETARAYVDRLRIRTPSLDSLVIQLSGGNQQKVVLSKWLASRANVLIFDEPTQGIDVGSKVEIYRQIGELAAAGAAILLVSSELREVLALSDRVLVMRRGRIAAEFAQSEATQEVVLRAAFGDPAA